MITRSLAIAFVAGLVSFTSIAQTSLENLVSESYSEWMLGKWQAQTDNGETVTLNMSWDLDKKVIVLHVKAGDMESKGYTALAPNAEKPTYVSFDNRGSVGKGSWDQENGELVLRVDNQTSERGSYKTAFVFSGSSSSGLQVRMHTIDSSGDLSSTPRMTFKFKKA